MGYGTFIKTWFRVGNKISWRLSFLELSTVLYFQKPFRTNFLYKKVQKKHQFVLDYLKTEEREVIEKWKNIPSSSLIIKIPKTKYIWIMWWQGEENMPPFISKCVSSIKKNSEGYKLVIIDKNNYKNYVELPEYIIEKHNKGIISFAQLSDIMRINLLSRHGGLWLDATIWCSKKISSNLFEMPFWTPHTKEEKTIFIQNNKIHCFIMSGLPGSKVLEYEKEFLSSYWKEHNVIVDYYLLDYSLMLAYYTFPDVKEEFDNLPYFGEKMYELVSILNNVYNKEELDRVLKENTFSKLNRYIKYKTKNKGKATNYAVLFEETKK